MKKGVLSLLFGLCAGAALGAVGVEDLPAAMQEKFYNSSCSETVMTETQPVLEDFFGSYYGNPDPVWFSQVSDLDALFLDMERTIYKNLAKSVSNPSIMSVVFLGMFGGLRDGLHMLEGYEFIGDSSEDQAVLNVSDMDMRVHMYPSGNYQSMEFSLFLDGDVMLKNLESGEYRVMESEGVLAIEVTGDIDLTTEKIQLELVGELTEYVVLETDAGGVKIVSFRTVHGFAEDLSEELYPSHEPLEYAVYDYQGNELFSGNYELLHDSSEDLGLFNLFASGISF